jgi:hypothetical protein
MTRDWKSVLRGSRLDYRPHSCIPVASVKVICGVKIKRCIIYDQYVFHYP